MRTVPAGQCWQIPPNPALAKYWPYLITGAVGLHVDYLQLKVPGNETVLDFRHLCDLLVRRTLSGSRLNMMTLDDYRVFTHTFLLVYVR